ncbi:MAG: family 10 glycosylhydrolase [Maribacter sp.]
MLKYLLLFSVLFCFNSCGILKSGIPQPKIEFRGVWIATVVNIDWPKNGNDTPAKQKEDYLKILDFYHNLNYNAVIVQVRAAGDAFYKSDFAPWSRFLTGKEGKEALWEEDTLDWMIEEAHQRGMEFHAWFNPYRASFDLKTDILSPTHDYFMHPEWMLQYGKKYYYNPGIPEVRNRFSQVINEVVTNYDLDAIHFDDYFYPYKIKDERFNDSLAFKSYAQKNQSLDDWRRSNVDSLVKNVHQTIKSAKPWVQLGISPFGVWKNNSTDPRGSDTRAGQTTYDDLYADPILWMREGWIDYIAPQVYWSMDLPVASHRKIVDWWAQNTNGTNLYIGNGAYKVRNNSDAAWNDKKELPNQFKLARNTPKVSGNILFSAKSLMNDNADVVSYLKEKYYSLPALTPITPLYKTDVKIKTIISSSFQNKEAIHLNLNNPEGAEYALIYASGKKAKTEYPIKKLKEKIYISEGNHSLIIPKDNISGRHFALTFLDRYARESEPIVIRLKEIDQK